MGKNNRKNKSNKPKKQNPKSEKSTKIETPKELDTKATKPTSEPNTENCVKSVAEYLDRVEKRIFDNERVKSFTDVRGQYAYRGMSNAKKYKLVSGARRAIAEAKGGKPKETEEFSKYLKGVNSKEFIDYHKKLIDGFKKKGHHKRDGQELSTLEILAEIQHFDGSTLLMDFTKNALIALYFAVCKHDNNGGRVYLANYKDVFKFTKHIKKNDVKDNYTEFDFELVMKSIFNNKSAKKKIIFEKRLQFWEAGLQNQRIPAQHSIFIFDTPDFKTNYFGYIDICAEKKPAIRKKLEIVFNINEISLFDDSVGYAKYFKYKPENPFDVGNDLSQDGCFKEAIVFYNKSIKQNPKFAAAYNNRGLANMKIDQLEEATKYLENAIRLAPSFLLAYLNLGSIKMFVGEYKEAIKIYDDAIEIDPKYAGVYNGRGNAKFMEGIRDKSFEDVESSIGDFDNAIKLDPNFSDAFYSQGIANYRLGNHKDAIEDFDEVNRLDQNEPFHNIYKSICKALSFNKLGQKNMLKKKLKLLKD